VKGAGGIDLAAQRGEFFLLRQRRDGNGNRHQLPVRSSRGHEAHSILDFVLGVRASLRRLLQFATKGLDQQRVLECVESGGRVGGEVKRGITVSGFPVGGRRRELCLP